MFRHFMAVSALAEPVHVALLDAAFPLVPGA
jgi:hypothetical protein